MARSRWNIAAVLALCLLLGLSLFTLTDIISDWSAESHAGQTESTLLRVHDVLSRQLDLVPLVTAPGAPADEKPNSEHEFCEAFSSQSPILTEATEQLPHASEHVVRAVGLLSGACRTYELLPASATAAQRREARLDLSMAARKGLAEVKDGLAKRRKFFALHPTAPRFPPLMKWLGVLAFSVAGLFLLNKRKLEPPVALPQMARMSADGSVSGQWMRTAMEAASEGILIVEAGGRIRSANAAAERVLGFGRGQLVGMESDWIAPDLLTSPEACGLLEHARLRSPQGIESLCHVSWFRRKGAAEAPTIVFVQASPEREAGTTTPSRVATAPRDPASAGASAHGPVELDAVAFARLENEILQVAGFGEIALAQLPPESEARPDLERLTRAAARAALLCRQAPPVEVKMAAKPIALNAFIEGFEQRLIAVLEPGTDLIVQTDATAGSVAADANLLEQSMLSLILPSLDVVPEPRLIRLLTSPGRIEVTLSVSGAANPSWRRVLGDVTPPKAARWLAAQGATFEQEVAENGAGTRFRIHLVPQLRAGSTEGSTANVA